MAKATWSQIIGSPCSGLKRMSLPLTAENSYSPTVVVAIHEAWSGRYPERIVQCADILAHQSELPVSECLMFVHRRCLNGGLINVAGFKSESLEYFTMRCS